MNKITTSTAVPTRALKFEALSNIVASFESLCLASGLEALREMMDHDAQAICGPRHARSRERHAHRWGKTNGKIAFHGGKVDIERPRLRGFDGRASCAELGGSGCRRRARQMGNEPDADQRRDAQVRSIGSAA